MNVFSAMEGKLLLIDADPTQTVDELHDMLVTAFSISKSDQILLSSDGSQLKHSNVVGSYGVGTEDKPILLFNRRLMIEEDEPNDAVVNVDAIMATLIAPPSVNTERPSNASSYLSELSQHAVVAETIQNSAKRCVDTAQLLCNDIRLQGDAIIAARTNLNSHFGRLEESLRSFCTSYATTKEHHDSLLLHFDADLVSLGKFRIHPALSPSPSHETEALTTLFDLFPSEQLRSYYAQYRKSHVQLLEIVSALQTRFAAMQHDVLSLNKRAPVDADFVASVSNKIRQGDSLLQSQQTITQVVKNNLHAAEDCPDVSALSVMWESHVNTLRTAALTTDRSLRDLVALCANAKVSMGEKLMRRIHFISLLQSSIHHLSKRVRDYEGELRNQVQTFKHFAHVKSFPATYATALIECIRRRTFDNIFRSYVNKYGIDVEPVRRAELARRESFYAEHGRFLPPLIAPKLTAEIPRPEIQYYNDKNEASGNIEVGDLSMCTISELNDYFHNNDALSAVLKKTFNYSSDKLECLNSEYANSVLRELDQVVKSTARINTHDSVFGAKGLQQIGSGVGRSMISDLKSSPSTPSGNSTIFGRTAPFTEPILATGGLVKRSSLDLSNAAAEILAGGTLRSGGIDSTGKPLASFTTKSPEGLSSLTSPPARLARRDSLNMSGYNNTMPSAALSSFSSPTASFRNSVTALSSDPANGHSAVTLPQYIWTSTEPSLPTLLEDRGKDIMETSTGASSPYSSAAAAAAAAAAMNIYRAKSMPSISQQFVLPLQSTITSKCISSERVGVQSTSVSGSLPATTSVSTAETDSAIALRELQDHCNSLSHTADSLKEELENRSSIITKLEKKLVILRLERDDAREKLHAMKSHITNATIGMSSKEVDATFPENNPPQECDSVSSQNEFMPSENKVEDADLVFSANEPMSASALPLQLSPTHLHIYGGDIPIPIVNPSNTADSTTSTAADNVPLSCSGNADLIENILIDSGDTNVDNNVATISLDNRINSLDRLHSEEISALHDQLAAKENELAIERTGKTANEEGRKEIISEIKTDSEHVMSNSLNRLHAEEIAALHDQLAAKKNELAIERTGKNTKQESRKEMISEIKTDSAIEAECTSFQQHIVLQHVTQFKSILSECIANSSSTEIVNSQLKAAMTLLTKLPMKLDISSNDTVDALRGVIDQSFEALSSFYDCLTVFITNTVSSASPPSLTFNKNVRDHNIPENENDIIMESVMRLQRLASDIRGLCNLECMLKEQSNSASKNVRLASADIKVAIFEFMPGDLVLFLPTTHNHWYAFNVNKPHHYLSDESMKSFGLKTRRRNFVLGFVVDIEAGVSSDGKNPYALPVETPFHIIHATEWQANNLQ